jgi:hypothetical protein
MGEWPMATSQQEADFAEMTAHFGGGHFVEWPDKQVCGEFLLDTSTGPYAMAYVRFEAADVKWGGLHLFVGCTFDGGSIGPGNLRCKMLRCTFKNVRFKGGIPAHFEDCVFFDCEFDHDVGFSHDTRLFRCRGIETCKGLELVRTPEGEQALQRDLAELHLPWWCRFGSTWASLRGVGTLPFFGLSYAGVPLLLLMIGGIDFYNRQVSAWSEATGTEPGTLAGLVRNFHRMAIPFETMLLLASGVALMAASTIYAARCPPRIKEFSLHRWVEEFGKHSINYLPLSWQSPGWRWAALILYVVGGSLALIVLCFRLAAAWGQLWRNLN